MRFILGLVVAGILSSSSTYAAPSVAQLLKLSFISIGIVEATGDHNFNLRSMQQIGGLASGMTQDTQTLELRSTKKFFDVLQNKKGLDFVRANKKRYVSFRHDSSAELNLDNSSYELSFKCEGIGSISFSVDGSEAFTESCQGILKVQLPANSILTIGTLAESEDLRIGRVKMSALAPEQESDSETGKSVVEVRSTKEFFNKIKNKKNIEYIRNDKQRFVSFAEGGSAELQLQNHPQKLNLNCEGSGKLLFLIDSKEVIKDCEQKMVLLLSAEARTLKIQSLVDESEDILLIDGVKLTAYPNLGTKGNFQVNVDGEWKGICCVAEGELPIVSDVGCFWEESKRSIKDLNTELYLDCPERGGEAADCKCYEEEWENFHGAPGDSMASSLDRIDENGKLLGAPIFPNSGRETCTYVGSDEGNMVLKTRITVGGDKWDEETGWPDEYCPDFRLYR